jgi:hypothetical protein
MILFPCFIIRRFKVTLPSKTDKKNKLKQVQNMIKLMLIKKLCYMFITNFNVHPV